jgi:hypothetical protein
MALRHRLQITPRHSIGISFAPQKWNRTSRTDRAINGPADVPFSYKVDKYATESMIGAKPNAGVNRPGDPHMRLCPCSLRAILLLDHRVDLQPSLGPRSCLVAIIACRCGLPLAGRCGRASDIGSATDADTRGRDRMRRISGGDNGAMGPVPLLTAPAPNRPTPK